MSFWDRIQLWEKMLLVLAGGMVCTLIFAGSKLLYSNYRIRKYTKLAAARKAHLENVRSSRSIIQLKGTEIPFGIRALEAGVEVEGVVVSRPVSVASCPATPSSARPTFSQLTLLGSETDSIKSHNFTHSTPSHTGRSQTANVGRPQVYQPSPYLSLPPPAHLARSGTSSRSSISSVTSSPSTRQDVHNCTRRAFSDSILPADAFLRTRSQSGTSTPQKSSSTLGSIPDTATLAKLDAKLPGSDLVSDRSMDRNGYKQRIGMNRIPSRTPSPEDGSSTLPSVHEGSTEEEASTGSESGQDSTHSQQSRRPQLLTAYSVPLIVTAPTIYGQVPETAQGDLSLLHTHRLSHVAEVGQLLPRTRQSRILSGANTLGLSPLSVVPSSGTFYSPAVLDPVYALDIALPSPALGNTGNLARSHTRTVTERQRSYSDPALDNIESLVDEHIQDAIVTPNRPITSDKSGWKSRESIDDREEESDLDQNKAQKKVPKSIEIIRQSRQLNERGL